ncbi:hypothetical protein KOR42_15600 [Thalassoglobus neptunius]|uniref:Uncharacterized protein n=1 Tax=Thalassoglobus neptunius TaxID=1938619 RepID=A0A5C5X6B7_9PLAN|nr:hypothetical protein KOR42_15600 [Thalassoglobus neptunius]
MRPSAWLVESREYVESGTSLPSRKLARKWIWKKTSAKTLAQPSDRAACDAKRQQGVVRIMPIMGDLRVVMIRSPVADRLQLR